MKRFTWNVTPSWLTELAHRKSTIVDVARRADTSVTSVSNLLNGRTAAMSAGTAQRIERAVKELGFRPSSTARALVRQRTALIGVLVSEIETGLFLRGIAELESRARERGFGVLIASARDVEDEARAIDLFVEKQTDGIVFLSTSGYRDDSHLGRAAAAGVPIVLVNRAGVHAELDQVGWDNAGGVAAVVDHLVGLGHRRIAHLYGPADRASTDGRLDGYRRALQRHGIALDLALTARTDYESEPLEWADVALAMMESEQPPTAIVAADDVVAGMVMRSLQEAGYAIPGDVSLVGIDDQPFARYLGMTTMRLPVSEAGLLAVDLLARRIADPGAPPENRMLECPLVIRSTTAPPREMP